jgi:hypothetical protein
VPSKLKAKHKSELKLLIRKIKAFFNKKRYHARRHVFIDQVVLAHVSKSLKVAEAVMSLVDAGFADEAFGLSRTMVEIALNLRFITNRYSERRAKRFADYIARWKLELERRTLKHMYKKDEKGNDVRDKQGRKIPLYTKQQLRTMMKHYRSYAQVARKYPNRTSWTQTKNRKASGGGAWMMAYEPDTHEFIEGSPFKWEFDYDWIYFWTSQYVHATAISVDAHAVWRGEPFCIKGSQKTQPTAGLAIFNAGIYLWKILVMAFRAIGHPFDASISDPLWKFLVALSKH